MYPSTIVLFISVVFILPNLRKNDEELLSTYDFNRALDYRTPNATIVHVPKKYFLHMEGTVGIYEIRVEVGTNIFRAFAFFDEGQLIVVTNGFQKKTQKIPKNEIESAKKIKKEYFDEKNKK